MPMRDTRAPLFASQFRQTNVIEKDAYVLPSHPSIHGSKAKQNARALVVVGVNALLAAANRSVPTSVTSHFHLLSFKHFENN